MKRVAINQDTAEAERAHYIYVQHAKMTSRRGKTVMCEELTDYRFTPSADGTDEQLLKVDGRFRRDKTYIAYTALLPRDEDKHKDADKDKEKEKEKDKDPTFDPNSNETIDRDIVENDGVWFPVTFSTEFKVNVLFFFHREIILDAQTRNFEKTHVTSRIIGDATPVDDGKPQAPDPTPQ